MPDSTPRFRHDLIATAVEVDGVRCVDVRDPDRDVSFRFYDFEYDLALQLDGRPASEVSAWAIATYGLDLTPLGIAEFATRLSELGFLITEGDLAADEPRKSERTTLGGYPAPTIPVPEAAASAQDDSQPLSQVVSRAVEQGARLTVVAAGDSSAASATATVVSSTGGIAASGRRLSSEFPLLGDARPTTPRTTPAAGTRRTTPMAGTPRPTPVAGTPRATPVAGTPRTTPIAGSRTSSPGVAAVPRWMADLDSTVIRPGGEPAGNGGANSTSGAGGASTSRELVPVPAPAPQSMGETMMGFAAVTEEAMKPVREMTVEPSEAVGTVMGFAAVTDEQIREAEQQQAAARVSGPPQGTSERRMPPWPEAVVMSPFTAEEVRRRPPEAGLRRSAKRAADRSTIAVVLVVAGAVIAAVVGYFFWSQHQAAMEARRVRVIAPRPAAVYRWFDATGSAVVGGNASLGFAAGGSVADVLPAGSHYAAGEIIAKLENAASREADVNRARSRVAYHQQVRDSMRTAGNLPEMRKAEIKIVEKQAQLDEAEAGLDRLVIRATEAGEVAEVVARRGVVVEANAPVVRVRTGTLRGEFVLPPRDADAAAHLGFCRVEIVGGIAPAGAADAARIAASGIDAGAPAAVADGTPRFADCKLVPPAQPPGDHFEVELPSSTVVLLGQPLRLARVRYDGVFPVPRSAVVRVGDADRLYVVGPGDVAQSRAITIADSDADEVVLSQGIDVTDRVIIDPPSDLVDGSPLTILH
jgi:hypothetical protein